MKIMDMPRGMGKTTTLFYLSQEYQIPVVTTLAAKRLYQDKYPAAICMTYEEYLGAVKKPAQILLDEINLFMEAAFPASKVLIATCSNDNASLDHIEIFYNKTHNKRG